MPTKRAKILEPYLQQFESVWHRRPPWRDSTEVMVAVLNQWERQWARVREEFFRGLEKGMSQDAFQIMMASEHFEPDGFPRSYLNEALVASDKAVSATLRRMKDRGWVTCEHAGARGRVVRLLPRGKRVFEKVRRRYFRLIPGILNGFTFKERMIILQGVTKLMKNVEGLREHPLFPK